MKPTVILFGVLLLSGLMQTAWCGDGSDVLKQVEAFSQKGEFKAAHFLAHQQIRGISQKLQVGAVIQRVRQEIKIRLQETITKEWRTSDSENSLRWSFKMDRHGIRIHVYGSGSSTSSSGQETEWILENPKEVAEFRLAVDQASLQLENDLKNYIALHAEDLLVLKALGIFALQAAFELKKNGDTLGVDFKDLSEMHDALKSIRFLGEQAVLLCVRKAFAERTERRSSSSGSFLFGHSRTFREVHRPAHETESCERFRAQLSVGPSDSVVAIDFRYFDRLLDEWFSVLRKLAVFDALIQIVL